MHEAHEILKNTFGYSEFRHHQADIISALLNNKDALVLMPTGGGKSLCYQIPSLVRAGTGVVISPLIALMQDQVEALKQTGINAVFINSSQDSATQNAITRELVSGKIDILYISPERLLLERTLNLLGNIQISLFAIDEAHCVSQWGHDFRKEYQQLSILHQRFPLVPRVALTATADQRTRDEIISQLQLQNAEVFINSFDRPNIRYTISEGQNARDRLWQFLEQHHAQDAGIVYCLSRKKVEQTAQWLVHKGRNALAYHAGLPSQVKQQNQQRFLRESGVIIVATIAFGMGIDKPDVRFVAHLSLPKSIEAYYQETGRAGRDGAPANAWMSYGLQDVIFLRQMMQESDGNEQYKRVTQHKLDAMLGLCESTQCRRQTLLAYFEETLRKPCGNCDSCLTPPQTWDGTQAAQKAMSCIVRTDQRFGVNYLIDVLLGKDTDRIRNFRHDKISTYGIGTELNATEWRGVFRQLISLGYINVDLNGYGSLFLNEQARPLLRSEITLELRQYQKTDKKSSTKQSSSNKQTNLKEADEALFNALREQRSSLAKELSVPPYIIFHDSSLLEMAKKRPATVNAMLLISGVGEKKLEKFGHEFLEVILEHPLPELLDNNLSDSVNDTLFHFQTNKNIDDLATTRNLKSSTIYSHLSDAIEMGLLDVRTVVQLEDSEYNEIMDAFNLFSDDNQKLKPIYEALNQEYNYDILKCIQASL
ncbi:ATP-dependent DNA helicase RecQ [hydrothermal vent metagenome]|uniref:DNA 3'-5' helicase n=1 Tax=hydrothermal vent metagenome TaxID=652676 RepID=A0A3B1AE87_9ZZZZ